VHQGSYRNFNIRCITHRNLACANMVIFGIVLATGCGNRGDPPPLGSGSGAPAGQSICLAMNCKSDSECGGCEAGKVVCAVAESRCVACGPISGGRTCAAGTQCTEHGDCVPDGTPTCQVSNGLANVICASDAQCAGCDPKHRVCNTASKQCVACTATSKGLCQSTDTCSPSNTCTPKCPTSCSDDADCSVCDAPKGASAGASAHACLRGKCAQCNDKLGCPEGKRCDDHGICLSTCGTSSLSRPDLPGKCKTDAQCAGCSTGNTTCKLPIGSDYGDCAFPAPGCAALASRGLVKLPSPFDRATATCDSDTACANVSADIDIGAILGFSSASIQYPMKRCAPLNLAAGPINASCGVCVPCTTDTDCAPLDLLGIAGKALGPLGAIGAALLLDQVFGPSDKKINMYCAKLLGDFGACIPCGDLLHPCGNNVLKPSTTTCTHGPCVLGVALSSASSCGKGCTAKVCKQSPACCAQDGEWTQECVNLADGLCHDSIDCHHADCTNKDADGWYCNADASEGYQCAQGKRTDGYRQCPGAPREYCRRKDPNDQKSQAVLTPDGTQSECFSTR
jgi:hypothetical protein